MKAYNDHDYCHVEMPNEYNKTLEYNHGEKSLKVPFYIPFNTELILPKMNSSENNLEKSYTDRKAKNILSGYACNLICSFDATKNKHDFGRGEDSIESLCKKVKRLCNGNNLLRRKRNDSTN